MVCHSFAPLVVLVTALLFLQVQCKPVRFQKRGSCATEDPDASFLDALQNVKVDEAHPQPGGSEARKGPIEIETWFHIVSSKSEEKQVSDDMVDEQVGDLSLSGSKLRLIFDCHALSWPFYKMPTMMLLSNIVYRESRGTSMMNGPAMATT